ncbi:type IV secretory system conjugative DNA transfer family protein [Aestuariibius sp. 2305UL40-4]|uniref:type IV secretory system conjugative DNA transfer family protein n=1 Tax=Aestuariibius violaceus TaxID=3234132 RepID=UPI00398F358A
MTWTKPALGLTTMIILTIYGAEPAAAQFYDDQFQQALRAQRGEIAIARFLSIALSTGAGFVLGWLLSPDARVVRGLILMGLALMAVLVALLDYGVWGWSATALVSVVGFFVALGYWIGRSVRRLVEVPTTFGSANWATPEEIAAKGLFTSSGLQLGTALDGQSETVIRYGGDRHLLTIAPTRKGKGTTQIIPNLLTYEGSALVIDPKGENALVTAKARQEMGQTVHIVDPWGITADLDMSSVVVDPDGTATVRDSRAARFNPLDWLELGDVDITENAMLLADALVVPEGEQDPFWLEEAKALLQGVILYVATDDREDGQRHLGRVRDLMLLDGEDLTRLFERMLESPHHIVASTGARCLQKEAKLLSNVMASAQAQTHMLDSARLRESLSSSDFAFEDLKRDTVTIYLVLPSDRMHTFHRWLRLLVQQAITVNARDVATQPERPVLLLLDELPALGKLTMVQQAYGLMAGFGMQLWGIVQDAGQLKATYGEGWETFIGNSGVVQYFGSRDRMTAEYFSALCGETTVWTFTSALSTAFGVSSGKNGGSSSRTNTETDTRAAAQRKLAYPDELMRMGEDRQVIFIEEMPPIAAFREPWYAQDLLKRKGVDLRSKEMPGAAGTEAA